MGVVFVITLALRLPARVLTALLPTDVVCDSPGGTVWSGSCAALRAGTLVIAGLSWQLHPGALLHLQLAADLTSEDPHGQAQARLGLDGAVQITALAATLALPAGLALVPAGTSGNMHLAIDSARLEGGHLVAVQGRIALQQLHIASPAADLGGFELQFAPPDPNAGIVGQPGIVGQLRDLDGPLSVIGVLQLSRTGSYDLEGSVAPKPDAGADLTQVLQLLGPPDAQGRRAFSIGGTL